MDLESDKITAFFDAGHEQRLCGLCTEARPADKPRFPSEATCPA